MRGVRINAAPRFPDNPFKLGVASGEPTQDGFVLWTRLAPSPFDEMSGMPLEPVVVEWQVSSDEGMRKVVAKGSTIADPTMGHSIHVEVSGLGPTVIIGISFVLAVRSAQKGVRGLYRWLVVR